MDLSRFVAAQDSGGTYDRALRELRAGRKTSHWMWFVFPQVAGLGRSATAQHYALAGLAGGDPVSVLGSVDATKLRSSMTLFTRADPDEPVYAAVLDQYFGGDPDEATLQLL